MMIMARMLILLQSCVLLLQISIAMSTPANRSKKDINDEEFGKTYLQQYGWAAPGAMTTEEVGFESLVDFEESVKEFQQYFRLNVTGTLDQETVALMKKPRCGNADKVHSYSNGGVMINTGKEKKNRKRRRRRRRKRYLTVGSKWHTDVVTYGIKNFTPKVGKQKSEQAIIRAFAVWGKHIPIIFKKIPYEDNPDIRTFFAEGYHNDNTAFDGVGGFLAHAYYPGPNIGGDTHFDLAEPWTYEEGPHKGNDLFLVAVHELGHALGLGHSPDPAAIMAPVYRYHPTKNFVLPDDDIKGIQEIYGSKNTIFPRPPVQPTRPPPPDTPRATDKSGNTLPTTSPSHRITRRTTTRKTTTTLGPTSPPVPDLCTIEHYDAITFIRGELFVFSGIYMWRKRRSETHFGEPILIQSFWPEIREGIDAAYEDLDTGKITFFKGYIYWRYEGTTLLDRKHIRYLGMQNLDITAAVWWKRNHKTYLFSKLSYWRMTDDKVEPNYPKTYDIWKGIPEDIDAAFTSTARGDANYTFFVKGDDYFKFHNLKVKKLPGFPRSFKTDWLKCGVIERSTTKNDIDENSSLKTIAILCVCLIVIALLISGVSYVMWRRQRKYRKKGCDTDRRKPYIATGRRGETTVQILDNGGDKTMCVTAMQQRWRLMRFSLAEKV